MVFQNFLRKGARRKENNLEFLNDVFTMFISPRGKGEGDRARGGENINHSRDC